MTARQILIARRFCGPPQSGNGGYVAGLLAKIMPTDSQVTLHAPPPLDTPLDLLPAANGMQLRHDGRLIASVRPHQFALELPPPPSYGEAEAAEARFAGISQHDLPDCFVCGTRREPYDGLRIFSGPLATRENQVAAIWCPDTSLVGDRGEVACEFLWAALDCPGFFAVRAVSGPALLGRFAARILQDTRPGEPLLVLGWPLRHDGRKHYAGTALYRLDGSVVGYAEATWISVAPGGAT